MLIHNWKHEFKIICRKTWEILVEIFYIWLRVNNQNVTEPLWVTGKRNGGHCAYRWCLHKPKISLPCDFNNWLVDIYINAHVRGFSKSVIKPETVSELIGKYSFVSTHVHKSNKLFPQIHTQKIKQWRNMYKLF
jgi:hypothetical protein